MDSVKQDGKVVKKTEGAEVNTDCCDQDPITVIRVEHLSVLGLKRANPKRLGNLFGFSRGASSAIMTCSLR